MRTGLFGTATFIREREVGPFGIATLLPIICWRDLQQRSCSCDTGRIIIV